MERNPYAPPRADVGVRDIREVTPSHKALLASRGQRFLNLLLDTVGEYTLGGLLAIAAIVVDDPMEVTIGGHPIMFGIVITLAYYVPCETLWGRTPAKLITGTRVVAERGGRPSANQVLPRTIVRLVPFEAFSFVNAEDAVGFHDRCSGTRVIRTRGITPALRQALQTPAARTPTGPLGI